MNTAIKVENLSKIYRLGEIGTGTISRDVHRWWTTKVLGKEDPFLKIGQTNDRTSKGTGDLVYSLQDINFDITQGEALGIIGRNGAGKSTLLKILSRVTAPTTGTIKLKGRVASLLEVGTGFHPELTGRENIYLNGAILGMRKKEITRKMDEIVAFSGVERYIDTPVKRYSSGMYVRLAFAVAAHLESEILIVDEVLAVGDAEFQQKCIGKMGDVSKGEGRTILFVSHNMLAIKSLCKTGLLMHNGRLEKTGLIHTVVDHYLQQNNSNKSSEAIINKETNGFTLISVTVSNNGIDGHFNIEDELVIDIKTNTASHFSPININIFFNVADGSNIFTTCSPATELSVGEFTYQCKIPAGTLNNIMYNLEVMVVQEGPKILHHYKDILNIEGNEKSREGAWLEQFPGLVRPQYFKWNITKNNE